MVADESELKTPIHVGRTKEHFWRKMLARFSASGLTQVDFCKQEGLNAGKFSWWKREIRLRDAESRKLKNSTDKHISEAYWRRILVKFKRSGLSKDDFCRKEQIKPAAFVWWRGELERRDAAKSTAIAQPVNSASRIFVPVEMPEPSSGTSADSQFNPIAEVDLRRGTVRVFEKRNHPINGLLTHRAEGVSEVIINTAGTRIFICTQDTDMRKSFSSLHGIIRSAMHLDPLSGYLFVFRNRRADRIKCVYFDNDGFAMWYKMLLRGTFQFPDLQKLSSSGVEIEPATLRAILDGVDLSSIRKRERFRPPHREQQLSMPNSQGVVF